MLGANDGVVSTACLIVGVAGAGASLRGGAHRRHRGLAAGALSMALGEYVSVASQRDIEQADLRIERQALEEHPVAELRELAQIWEARGHRAGAGDGGGAPAHRARTPSRPTPATSSASPRTPRPARCRRPLASLVAFTLGALVPLVAFLVAPDDGRSARRRRRRGAWPSLGLGWIGAVLGSAKRLRAMARVGLGGAAAMGITLLIGELTGAALG